MITLLYANAHNSDTIYATSVPVPDPFFYLETTDGKRRVFLDSREFGVFQDHTTQKDIECILLDPLLVEAAAMPQETTVVNRLMLLLLEKFGDDEKTVRVPNSFPLDMADCLRENGYTLDVALVLFPKRSIKQQWEVDAIRESLKRTHVAFQKIEEILKVSEIVGDEVHYEGTPLTSELLKLEAEKALLEVDMLNIEGMIVSCGDHAAIPHHPGSGLIRPHQTIICDIFPRHRATNYYADMTRTYVKGEPTEQIRKQYDAVLQAQLKGIAAIKAGVSAQSIHQIGVDYFAAEGFVTEAPNGFVHGTGHGLGLDVHEPPRMNAQTTEVLEVGNIVTVEPGLYYTGIGGVRIEDVVVVTADSCENLTQYPTDQWVIA